MRQQYRETEVLALLTPRASNDQRKMLSLERSSEKWGQGWWRDGLDYFHVFISNHYVACGEELGWVKLLRTLSISSTVQEWTFLWRAFTITQCYSLWLKTITAKKCKSPAWTRLVWGGSFGRKLAEILLVMGQERREQHCPMLLGLCQSPSTNTYLLFSYHIAKPRCPLAVIIKAESFYVSWVLILDKFQPW